jgi:seryl-tRNA synthetase
MNKELLRQIIREELELGYDVVEMNAKIDEYAELSNEIDVLNSRLKKLKSKYSSLEGELRPVLEELTELEQSSLNTEKYLLTIKRKGYSRTTYSYKDAFVAAISKVNAQTRRVLNELYEATAKTHKVASSIGVQSLKENKLKSLISFVSRLFKGLRGSIKKLRGNDDKLNKMLKDMV